MEIKIECDSKLYLPLENILDFQGDLKSLDPLRKEKLKNQILKHGFSAPIFVWKNNAKYYCLDGHQRISACKELKSIGYKMPDLPCVEIFAKTQLEAKKKLLSYVSQFGKVEQAGLYQFMQDADISVDDLEDYALPDINVEAFTKEFFEDLEKQEEKNAEDEKQEDSKMNQCPNCGHVLKP